MSNITVINEKGLFGESRGILLATNMGIDLIETHGLGLDEGKEKQQILKLVQILKKFPNFEQTIYLDSEGERKKDFRKIPMTKGYNGSTVVKVSGPNWLHVGGFVSKSSFTEWPSENKGWEALKEFMPLLPLFLDLTEKLGIWREGYYLTWQKSRLKSIVKNHSLWSIKEESVEDMIQATSYAIYSENHGYTGFLNAKGYYTPLAGCRLFESAEAARRTIVSKGLSDVVVVDVEISAKDINPIIPIRGSFNNLMEAMAILERNRLHDSLNQFQMEELIAQIEKLKEKLGEEIKTESSSKPTKRI